MGGSVVAVRWLDRDASPLLVIPAQAGIQCRESTGIPGCQITGVFREDRAMRPLDSGLRRNDGREQSRQQSRRKL